VTDWRLPDFNGTEMVKRIRELGVETSVLLCTSDPLALMKEGMWDETRTGMLSKPLVQQTLLRAVAEHLLVVAHLHKQGEGMTSHGSLNISSSVKEYGAKLVTAVDAKDTVKLRDLCGDIRSASGAAGDTNLMRVAENALNILDSKGMDIAQPLLKELIRLTTKAA
jgi:DNA-binding response OmpR family regulator